MIFDLPEWAQNHEKAWFWASQNIKIFCFVVIRVLRQTLFYLSESITFEVQAFALFSENSWFVMFCFNSVFSSVQSSLFKVLVGSGDLQNRPWPFKKHGFA